MKTYYNYCERHGCNLDPGEECEECRAERRAREDWQREYGDSVRMKPTGQVAFKFTTGGRIVC
jgi:hypothetical protein